VVTAQILRDRGVRYAFGVPGESFLGLLDAYLETPEINLVATRHEGGAAFMADAVGKLTGQPAICMGTRGVGSANLAIGIHTAQQDSTPMLALVGQVETPYRHREALQEVELAPFLGQITKWAVEAPSGAELPRLASEAYRRSITGRPGPVAIALRGDILDELADDRPYPSSAAPVTAIAPETVERILDLIESAERPVVIAGGGVLRSGAVLDLVSFAGATQTPVATAFRRLDAFPTDHPLSLGSLSFGTPKVIAERVRSADVVISIGTRLGETTTLAYTVPGQGAKLVQIDIAPDDLGKTYPAEIAIEADAGIGIRALLARARQRSWPDRTADNEATRQLLTDALDEARPASDSGVDPAVVMRELSRQLPPDAVLTSDAGNFFGWVQRYGSCRQPGTFLGPVSGAMGYAVPAAVAAALVRRNGTPAVAFAGDGGFLMTANELAVAAQHRLRVICVVFNNALFGTIRLHQEREYPGRISGTEIWTPDLVKLAQAFGGLGLRIDRNADASEVVNAAIAHDGISIIEVPVDRENIAVGVALSTVGQTTTRGAAGESARN
jgi:acetolactate synthase I/II/III large subunit